MAKKARRKTDLGLRESAWYAGLQHSKSGKPLDCLANGATILRDDPAFAGRIRFDEHRGAPICRDLRGGPAAIGESDRHRRTSGSPNGCQRRGVPLRRATCVER